MPHRYDHLKLETSDLAGDWLTQFRRWLSDAVAAELSDPTAMIVATAGADSAPGARTVLLKDVDERGLVFFTNYGSRKAGELDANPRVALVVPWLALGRQVIVDGSAERVSAEESNAYFGSRPHDSQLGAIASRQSTVIASREELERRFAEVAERYPEGSSPPRPGWWGGYRVVPHAVEFWQGRPNRLHDRLRFRLEDDGEWRLERLSP